MFTPPLALALLSSLLLGACALPANTALGDWSRSASVATDRPSLAPTSHADAARAMQRALGLYFQALGVLWDQAELTFSDADFAALAARAAPLEPAAATAIGVLGGNLHAASTNKPMRWLPPDNSGQRPLPEDGRLADLIAASDGAVQTLLASLSRAVTGQSWPATPATQPVASDPVLHRLQQEAQQTDQAARGARQATRENYARILPEIGGIHAALKAQGRLISQRSMERQVFLADERLRRSIATFPPEPVGAMAMAWPQ
jgi:hypothetical protein